MRGGGGNCMGGDACGMCSAAGRTGVMGGCGDTADGEAPLSWNWRETCGSVGPKSLRHAAARAQAGWRRCYRRRKNVDDIEVLSAEATGMSAVQLAICSCSSMSDGEG